MLGYENNANVCYFNALMTSLLSCDAFVTKCYDIGLHEMLIRCGKNLNPFINSLPWTEYMSQECAHETFSRLVEYLEIDDIFRIETLTYNVCGCTKTIEPIKDIGNYIKSESNIDAKKLFFNHRVGDLCDKCGKKRKHFYVLSKMANIIVIVLEKYFKKSLIDFSDQLSFETDDGGKVTYELKAQIEHSGTISGGHYYCVVKRGGEWYQVDDLSYFNSQPKPSPNTYMILYEQVRREIL